MAAALSVMPAAARLPAMVSVPTSVRVAEPSATTGPATVMVGPASFKASVPTVAKVVTVPEGVTFETVPLP